MQPSTKDSRLADRVAALFVRNSGRAILVILALTVLLLFPTFLLQPTEQASQEPGGPVFDLRDRVNRQFPERVHIASFIVEDREGDVLRQAPLWELYRNEQALRESDMAEFLFSGYDVDTQRQLRGIFTVADAINDVFRLNPASGVTLETASDAQVKDAVSLALAGPNGNFIRESFSKDASMETVVIDGRERTHWKAAALSIFVVADNAKLGGGPQTVAISNDESALVKERLNRRMLATLRGEQRNYQLWGVALDVNLTSQEQGRTAMPYIAATVVLVLVVVGVTLRSVKAVGAGISGTDGSPGMAQGHLQPHRPKVVLDPGLDCAHRHDFPGGRFSDSRGSPVQRGTGARPEIARRSFSCRDKLPCRKPATGWKVGHGPPRRPGRGAGCVGIGYPFRWDSLPRQRNVGN